MAIRVTIFRKCSSDFFLYLYLLTHLGEQNYVFGGLVSMMPSATCPSSPSLPKLEQLPKSFSPASGKTLVQCAPAFPNLVSNGCRPDVHAYISSDNIYLTRTGFSDFTDPLSLPAGMQTGRLTSALFINDTLLLVSGGQLLRYDYISATYVKNLDVTGVTDLVSSPCCDVSSPWCVSRNDVIMAYHRGVATSHVHISTNGGATFTRTSLSEAYTIYGASISDPFLSVKLLVLSSATEAMFISIPYTDTPEMTPDIYPRPFKVVPGGSATDALGARSLSSGFGSILAWDAERIFYSLNSGISTSPAGLRNSGSLVTSAFLTGSETFTQVVTASSGHFVALTSNSRLLFGWEGFTTETIELTNHGLTINAKSGLRIDSHGFLHVLNPHTTTADTPIIMNELVLDVTSHLVQNEASLPSCPGHVVSSEKNGEGMLYMDKQEEVNISTRFINKQWTEDNLLVSLSKPSLVYAMSVYAPSENDGELTLVTTLREKPVSPTQNRINESMTNVRVGSIHTSLSCRLPVQSVTQLVVGCPPNKYIRIAASRNVNECPDKRDYTYTIDGKNYDPTYRGSALPDNPDKTVTYDFMSLGCPRLAYYNAEYEIKLNLYENNKLLGEVNADFVLYEIHGLQTYTYAEPGDETGCRQTPQTWQQMLGIQPDPTKAWTRENYCSCKSVTCSTGQRSTDINDVTYQVLNTGGRNILKWKGQHNGIYVFEAVVVDPEYSYCDLRTRFSVEVYGADVTSDIQVMAVCGSLTLFGLVCVFLVYLLLVQYKKNTVATMRREQKLEKVQFPEEVLKKIDPSLVSNPSPIQMPTRK